MPARQAFLFIAYLPLVSGNFFSSYPVLIAILLVGIVAALTVCKQVTLTNDRVVVDRPLYGWLSYLPRLGHLRDEVLVQHPLSELLRAEVDGHHVVPIYRSGLPAPYLTGLPTAKEAEDFAAAINQALEERLEGIIKVSEREAPKLELSSAQRSGPSVRCPYCHDSLAVAATRECSGCATVHHTECLMEHGKCSILGCASPQRVAA